MFGAVFDGVNDPQDALCEVKVQDTQEPIVVPIAVPAILWPPNHKLTPVTVIANAYDCSGSPVTLDVSVSSDEPVDDTGDGDTEPDIIVEEIDQSAGIIYLQLRAERSGTGNGRTYTITVTATDESGNSSSAAVIVAAPHDTRKQ